MSKSFPFGKLLLDEECWEMCETLALRLNNYTINKKPHSHVIFNSKNESKTKL